MTLSAGCVRKLSSRTIRYFFVFAIFIFAVAQANFLAVAELDGSVYMGTQALEFIRADFTIAGKKRVRKSWLFVDQIVVRLINGHRISGGQEADNGNDRRIAPLLIILNLSVTQSEQYPDRRNARS